MSPLNYLWTALRGVTANKLRFALTALGVIIGVASVIATLALGNGARAAVENSFRFLGSDQIQISSKGFFAISEEEEDSKPITYQEGLDLTGAAPLVDRVDMSLTTSVKVRKGQAVLDAGATGTTAQAIELFSAQSEVQPVGWPSGQPLTGESFIEYGRFFTPLEVVERAEVCVLAWQTAQDLFGGDDPIGETVWVNRKPYQVIGVLTELEAIDPSQRTRSKPNDGVILPISTAVEQLFDEDPNIQMTAHVSDPGQMEKAKAQVAAFLRERHQIEQDADGNYNDDFMLTTKSDLLGAQQAAASTFSILLTAMAIVSLTVGGIGIMNVMLISVSERTREIGVRLAVGARRVDVVAQFLLEALILSTASGVLGIVAGILTIPLAASLNQGIALLAPGSIPLSFGVALLTGVVFGLYPAVRASRLDPIQALRYE